MEKRINIYGAKTYLSELINQVQEAGMPCTICRKNQSQRFVFMLPDCRCPRLHHMKSVGLQNAGH